MCYSQGKGWHPKGPKQARAKIQQEPDEIQQRKLQSLSLGQTNPYSGKGD